MTNINEISPDEYTDTTFGQFLRQRREELRISVRALANAIGMSPVYLSDIERGNRNAPNGTSKNKDFMAALVRELHIADDEKDAFYAMAEVTNDRYTDMKTYFRKNPKARLAFSIANKTDVPDEEWQRFIDRLKELNQK